MQAIKVKLVKSDLSSFEEFVPIMKENLQKAHLTSHGAQDNNNSRSHLPIGQATTIIRGSHLSTITHIIKPMQGIKVGNNQNHA